MVWPFLVMITASLSNSYDYHRFSPLPRALWDRNDRFMRFMASCYSRFPSHVYPEAPAHWSSWIAVSRDPWVGSFASHQIDELCDAPDSPVSQARRRRASDYAEFNRSYDIANSVCNFDPNDVAGFVRRSFEARLKENDSAAYAKMSSAERAEKALELLNRTWPVRYESFFGIRMLAQQRAPLHHASWDYDPGDAKSRLYQDFKRHYRDATDLPMSRTVPFLSRPLCRGAKWFYDAASPEWQKFVHTSYPRRLLRIRVDSVLVAKYRRYVEDICKRPEVYNRLTGGNIKSFNEVKLAEYENSTLWRNFIPRVPLSKLEVLSAERSWGEFLLAKYGSLEEINRVHREGLEPVKRALDSAIPFDDAIAVTFVKRGYCAFLRDWTANYRMVGEYLFVRGRAFANTLLLVLLSIAASLTVNPMAAYALSRFKLRCADRLLLFLLATMAFPAAVTAIPGFLLIRDLGLLNTFAALVLPTLANGMSIFVLKGFFDGLPRELYEAAEIDGASEWQMFWRITLPMTSPILAVNALTAFVTAYNSWEWALLVCQNREYWTLAVWMYQMSQQMSDRPWAVMAGFVLVSIPTAVVFITCQKVILKGIVLPSMK